MATGSTIELRRRLVEHLRRRGFLSDARIASAFLSVPREAFLPEYAVRQGSAAVYRDEAIVVRRDPVSGEPQSSSSQPAIMALMLQMLDVQPGDRVLEVGAGTGYNAALLDRLVRPDGRVVTVDVDANAAAGAAGALHRVGSEAQVVVADGRLGLPGPQRFDRMMVTASSAEIPAAWHDQLVTGGRLVVPLRLSEAVGSAHAVSAFRRTPGGFDSVAITCGGFMPLRAPAADMSEGPAPPPLSAEPEPEPEPGSEPTAELPSADAAVVGPPLNLAREAVAGLHIVVRYSDQPPSAQWVFEHPGHWIGVDLGAPTAAPARPPDQ